MKQRIQSFLNNIRTKGTIAPSSSQLVKKVLQKIDFDQPNTKICQLWFGTGVFAEAILETLNSTSSLSIFEIDPNSQIYYDKIKTHQSTYHQDSAANIHQHYSPDYFDYIISTLPLASLPSQTANAIKKEIKEHLKNGGTLLQYQYSLYSKRELTELFGTKPKIDFELLNLPPAFIYQIIKNANNTIPPYNLNGNLN